MEEEALGMYYLKHISHLASSPQQKSFPSKTIAGGEPSPHFMACQAGRCINETYKGAELRSAAP